MAALLELAPILVALACLALAAILTVIVVALIKPIVAAIRSIPGIGGTIAGPIEGAVSSIEQSIFNKLGEAFGKVDSAIGWMLHSDARLLDWTWRELKGWSASLAHVAEVVGGHVYSVTGLRGDVQAITRLIHATISRIETIVRDAHRLEQRVKTIEHDVSHGIGHDVLPRLGKAERELGTIESKVIPGIDNSLAGLFRGIDDLRKWVTDNFVTEAEVAGAATGAAILTAAGAGYLNCNSNPFRNNPAACGLWSALAKLLPLGILLTVAFDFPEFVSTAEEVAQLIGGAVASIEGSFPLALDPLPPPA